MLSEMRQAARELSASPDGRFGNLATWQSGPLGAPGTSPGTGTPGRMSLAPGPWHPLRCASSDRPAGRSPAGTGGPGHRMRPFPPRGPAGPPRSLAGARFTPRQRSVIAGPWRATGHSTGTPPLLPRPLRPAPPAAWEIPAQDALIRNQGLTVRAPLHGQPSSLSLPC
jgi:hypothetical protein